MKSEYGAEPAKSQSFKCPEGEIKKFAGLMSLEEFKWVGERDDPG